MTFREYTDAFQERHGVVLTDFQHRLVDVLSVCDRVVVVHARSGGLRQVFELYMTYYAGQGGRG